MSQTASQTPAITVQVVEIIGTTTRVYSAWEPDTDDNHATIRWENGERLGRVGTRRAGHTWSSWAEHAAWQTSECQRAYDAIVAAHPEAIAGRRSMATITIHAEG